MLLTYPGNYTYNFSLTDYPDTVSNEFQFYVDPCSVTSFLDEHNNEDLEINGLSVQLTAIPDFWAEHALYLNPDLCEKQLHLLDESGNEVTDFVYENPTLGLSYSGNFNYYFSLVNYPEIVSNHYAMFVPSACAFDIQ